MIKLNYKAVSGSSIFPEFNIGQCQNCKKVFVVPIDLQKELWDLYDNGLNPHQEQLTCCSTPKPLWILDILLTKKDELDEEEHTKEEASSTTELPTLDEDEHEEYNEDGIGSEHNRIGDES